VPATVRVHSYDVRQRLEEFGLTLEILLDAVRAVVAAHANCTENDPPAARLWDGWRMGTRRLRELLRPLGWEKDDADTFSVIINHQAKMRIVVVNSAEGTGLVPGVPLNLTKKGPRSREAADTNAQLVLNLADFREEYDRHRRMAEAVKYATWGLCIFADADEVRAELSQAIAFRRGFAVAWEERIILIGDGKPPYAKIIIAPDDGGSDDGLSPEFPIEIRRRS
jgi:hypothetical protein